MSIEAKLEQHKKIRANRVSYTIRKLTPALFLDRDYMLPISHVMEFKDQDQKEAKIAENLDAMKDKIRDIIIKGTVEVRFFLKKLPIEKIIDEVMEQPEVYTFLMAAIINHTLSVKKKRLIHSQ